MKEITQEEWDATLVRSEDADPNDLLTCILEHSPKPSRHGDRHRRRWNPPVDYFKRFTAEILSAVNECVSKGYVVHSGMYIKWVPPVGMWLCVVDIGLTTTTELQHPFLRIHWNPEDPLKWSFS